ncbi:hypothetical protein MNJPNG_04970 [Cupriavidus oxalaticus]|uniref:hypothetical protein n=1 Tax=Cupriavidus oxalaticus TaxID=96344 RepID=UPI003F73B97F
MDYAFSIALNQPAGRRDMETWVGDDFDVVAKLYTADGDADPITDYTGKVVTLVVGRQWIPPGATITGVPDVDGNVTFDMSTVDWSRYWGLVPWQMKMADGSRNKTIAEGYIVVYGNTAPCAWPNDYGFGWGGW